MQTATVSTDTLDQILALQFLIAWAGEGQCEPARLGWWRTDVVDELGGGDFFRRLAPRTHRWAALETARRAAILTDRKARRQMPDEDAVRTLFFWGFELDEQLTERLRDLKRFEQEREDGTSERKDPHRALPFPAEASPDGPCDREALEKALKALAPDAAWQALSTGRQLKTPLPEDRRRAACLLAASLAPLADQYLPPFFRL